MTLREREALEVIEEHVQEHRIAPTLSEIGEELGISHVSAKALVDRLVLKGHVRRYPGRSRGLEVVA